MPNNTSRNPTRLRHHHRNEGEIQQMWCKFGAQEITALKDKDDLVAQVQAKYSLDRTHAQREVDTFAKGRQL